MSEEAKVPGAVFIWIKCKITIPQKFRWLNDASQAVSSLIQRWINGTNTATAWLQKISQAMEQKITSQLAAGSNWCEGQLLGKSNDNMSTSE